MTESKPFGSYELLGRISAGGMAEVFRAKDKRGNLVALKKILPQVAQDDEFIEMFEDEAAIARQLEHPHIARMLDFGRVEQTYYIAFEYVHGKDLRMIFNSCVRLDQAANIPFLVYVFTRIGEGLSYAHARRDANGQPVSIVHRDVSPQNIVVSTSGDVKLIDFGIAKAAGKLSRTQVGTIKGKFGYMSPEQVKGLPIDASTDVFSLGICMWELLTLKRLFHADNELLVLQKIKTLKVLPPSQHNPAVPAELDRIVLKALAKDMNERYRAAKDLYKDLNQFSATHQVAATRDEIAETMRQLFPEMASPDGSRNDRHMPIPLVGASIRFGSALPQNGEIRRQETYKMSAENKGGSDLDIFEGLGKKSVPQQRASTAPPAPPNSSMRTPVAAPVTRQDGPPSPSQPPQPPSPMTPAARDLGKKTLMGMHAPPGMIPGSAGPTPGPMPGSSPPPSGRPTSQSNMPTAPLSTRSSSSSSMPAVRQPTSDAPPARGSLPPVAAPPAKPTPPPASTRPAPYAYAQDSAAKGGPLAAGTAPAKGGGLEMDWDDEDEATHLFDKKSDEPATRPGEQDRPSQRLPSTSTTPSPSRPAPSTSTSTSTSPSQSPPSVSRVSAPPPVPPSVRMPAVGASSPPPSVRIPSAAPAPSQRPSGSMPIVAPPPPPAPPMTAPGGFGSMNNLTGGSQPPPSASLSAQFARTAPSPGSMGPTPERGPLSNPIPPPPGMMSPNSQRPYPPPGFPPPPGVASPGMQPLGAQQGSLPPPQHYGSMPPPSQQHYAPQPSTPPQPYGGSQPPPHGMAPQTHTTPMQMPEQRPQYHSQPPHAQSRMEATQMVRAPSSSNAGLFIGLGLGVAGLAVAGILLFALPHSAKLGVTVVDSKGMPVSHAEVSVDGKKACDTSPCTVDSVSAGGHTVRVVAPGYESAERAVTTEARKDSSIELMVTGGGSGSKAGTGLKVAGSQPGVKLSIDGKDIGPLPQELHDLTPGEHKIHLAGSERYEPMDKTVTIAKDETLDLGPISLKVMKGKATITLGTPGAKVYIVSGNDRRDLPSFPISVDIDTSKSWALEAQKPGFTEYKQPISFSDGLAEKVFNVELSPKGAGGGAAVWTPPAGGGGGTAVVKPDPTTNTSKPDPTTKPTTTAAATTKPESASTAPAGEATLNLNSVPASSVVLDGKPLGNTPKKGVSVPPGAHTVIFVNAEEGLKKSMQVNVAAGETKTVIGKLRE